MIVGPRLRNIREEHGVPMGYLANALGITVSALIAIERGKKHANKNQVIVICDMFDMKKSDFLAKV
ncbi:helix-turn-helix domain-containing protein [Metabacillus sp. SLBN-84]